MAFSSEQIKRWGEEISEMNKGVDFNSKTRRAEEAKRLSNKWRPPFFLCWIF